MPTGMTFDSLVQDLQDYLEVGGDTNTIVARQMPRIINNAERSLADKFKIQGYQDVLTSAMEAGEPRIAKPDGWRNTVTFSIGTGVSSNVRKTLRIRGYELLRALYPDDTQTDEPAFYADYDFGNWLVGPAPSMAFPFEAIVYRLPDLLSSSNQQNYLTQYVPNALLFQCLVNMEPFLKEDSRLLTWKALLENEFTNIDGQEIRKLVDRAQTRSV